MDIVSQPIDAVITWVDGNDPEHQKKRQYFLREKEDYTAAGVASTRFRQMGELDFCLRSINKYASWLRDIYIVTDAQQPALNHLQLSDAFQRRIKIIDHRVIFQGFEQYLPCFNSLSIESLLWRIPELSEHFLYFNDDCFIVKPVGREDFLVDQKMILRGRWKKQRQAQFLAKILSFKKPDDHRVLQEKSAQLAGYEQYYFDLPHCPFLLRKSNFHTLFTQHPELLTQNISYRFRHQAQFWPISLAIHREISAKNVLFSQHLHSINIHPGVHSSKKIAQRLKLAAQKQTAFLCLQSLDMGSASCQKQLLNWLEEFI